MNDSFIFKGGKHSGKSYGLIKKIDPGYILWCEENAPGMLKDKKSKPEPKPAGPRIEPPEVSENPKSAIQPNMDFFNEGPKSASE